MLNVLRHTAHLSCCFVLTLIQFLFFNYLKGFKIEFLEVVKFLFYIFFYLKSLLIKYKNSSRLTIDLMDTQDEDETEANEEPADIEKWSDYVEKYCIGSSSATITDDLRRVCNIKTICYILLSCVFFLLFHFTFYIPYPK